MFPIRWITYNCAAVRICIYTRSKMHHYRKDIHILILTLDCIYLKEDVQAGSCCIIKRSAWEVAYRSHTRQSHLSTLELECPWFWHGDPPHFDLTLYSATINMGLIEEVEPITHLRNLFHNKAIYSVKIGSLWLKFDRINIERFSTDNLWFIKENFF
jgi:hypothetical protein